MACLKCALSCSPSRFSWLFNVVSARGPEASVPDFVAAPEKSDFGSQMVGLEVYNNDNEDLAHIEDGTIASKPSRVHFSFRCRSRL
jgi:hypothetical protein